MSFFERITGTVHLDNDDDHEEEASHEKEEEWDGDDAEVDGTAQLSVDVYQTPESIIIQTMVAGVRPEDLDISITREMVTIKGRREGPHGIPNDQYFHQELYWGTFARTISLPAEIEVEEAEAVEKHGLLIITLPKIDKNRAAKLEVKSHPGK